MSIEAIGPLEARLLAVERRQARIDEEVRGLKRDVIAIGQGIWDAWDEVGRVTVDVASPTTTPDCTRVFPNVCECIPLVLVLHDSYYGDTPLAYDRDNLWWTGCRMVPYPGTASCPAALTPIRYTLQGDDATSDWALTIAWKGVPVGANTCPSAAATCGDVLPQSRTSSAAFHCPPLLTTWGTTGGTHGQVYPTGINPTLAIGNGKIPACPNVLPDRLYLDDPVYGSTPLDFNGILWRGCKVVDFPGHAATPCPAVTGVALHYELLSTGVFRIRYRSATPATTRCPVASTCATPTNLVAVSATAVTVDSCAPFTAHITATAADGFKILGDGAGAGVLIRLADTPI